MTGRDTSLLLIMFVLSPCSTLLGFESGTPVAVPSDASYSVSVEFEVLGFRAHGPSLELYLDHDVGISLYLTEYLDRLLPGFYLSNDSTVKSRELVLEPGKRYSLVLNYSLESNRLALYLKSLETGYIATEVIQVPALFNQGLTFGDGVWYLTETSTLCMVNANLSKVVRCNFNPIPDMLRKKGYFHLGDLDHHADMLAVPLEKNGYIRPAVIAIYDPESLRLVRYSYTPQDHMPWTAMDRKGLVYTSEYSQVNKVYVYDLSQVGVGNYLEPIKVIKLDRTLENIQGGVVVDDEVLALTSDDGDHVYIVNIASGRVVGEISLPGLYEMEGIEYVKEEGEAVFYVLFNTQGLSRNILYRYELVREGELIELFNIAHEPLTRIRVLHDNKAVQLGNITVTKT